MARERIDQLLVRRGLFESRAKARAAVESGGVAVAGRTVSKPAEMIDQDALIVAEAAHPWVGRGALKLDHALSVWPVVVDGRIVLDLGASTGGFTEVCLSRGAAKVFAVDVGQGQLHARLARHPRVVDLSGTDVRVLDEGTIDQAPQLLVCDLSFIGLEKALAPALDLAAPSADLVCLVKPQFQVGRDRIAKGGLVKDEAARRGALDDVCAWLAAQGWPVKDRADSPIAGGDGNREFLVWARKEVRAAPKSGPEGYQPL